MISKNFDEFANQNEFPANFKKNAAKNRANLKGDSYECNGVYFMSLYRPLKRIFESIAASLYNESKKGRW